MGPWGYGTFHMGGPMEGGFMMIVFLIIVIAAAVLIPRYWAKEKQYQVTVANGEALEKLKIRYVNGEIDKETFLKIKEDIQ